MAQGDDAADGAPAPEGPAPDPVAAWATVTALTGELNGRVAAGVAAALAGARSERVRMLGRTPEDVRQALSPLEPSARRAVWRLSPRPSDPVSLVAGLNRQSLERGVDLRSIINRAAVSRPIADVDDALRDRVRVAPVQIQMLLIDEERVVLDGPTLVPGSGPSGWLISEPATVAAACALWQGTLAVSEPLPSTAFVMTERQRAVAAGLLQGETDAAIARTLRVSVRTVAAEVRFLMDAVGAQSRYQTASRLHQR